MEPWWHGSSASVPGLIPLGLGGEPLVSTLAFRNLELKERIVKGVGSTLHFPGHALLTKPIRS